MTASAGKPKHQNFRNVWSTRFTLHYLPFTNRILHSSPITHHPSRITRPNARPTPFTIYHLPFTNRILHSSPITHHPSPITRPNARPTLFSIPSSRFSFSSGFTLTELLLALNISFILVALCLTLFISTSKLLSRWQARSALKRDVNAVVHRLSLDITRASAASVEADSLLVLSQPGGRTVEYRMSMAEIARNDVAMNDPNEQGLSVSLHRALSNGGGLDKWKYKVSASNKRGAQSMQSASALMMSAQRRFQETAHK